MFTGELLTTSHRASNLDERERVLRRGGYIPECSKGECARVNGLIEVTRSLGDRWLKPVLDCTPEVVTRDLTADDAFLIIGSDGLFDSLDDSTVVRSLQSNSGEVPSAAMYCIIQFAAVILNLIAAAMQARLVTKEAKKGLSHCDIAFALAKMAYRNGSTDDISAYVLSLDNRERVRTLEHAQVTIPRSNGGALHSETSNGATVHSELIAPQTPAQHTGPEGPIFRPSSHRLLDATDCNDTAGMRQHTNTAKRTNCIHVWYL